MFNYIVKMSEAKSDKIDEDLKEILIGYDEREGFLFVDGHLNIVANGNGKLSLKTHKNDSRNVNYELSKNKVKNNKWVLSEKQLNEFAKFAKEAKNLFLNYSQMNCDKYEGGNNVYDYFSIIADTRHEHLKEKLIKRFESINQIKQKFILELSFQDENLYNKYVNSISVDYQEKIDGSFLNIKFSNNAGKLKKLCKISGKNNVISFWNKVSEQIAIDIKNIYIDKESLTNNFEHTEIGKNAQVKEENTSIEKNPENTVINTDSNNREIGIKKSGKFLESPEKPEDPDVSHVLKDSIGPGKFVPLSMKHVGKLRLLIVSIMLLLFCHYLRSVRKYNAISLNSKAEQIQDIKLIADDNRNIMLTNEVLLNSENLVN
jgi:hypothetical protein